MSLLDKKEAEKVCTRSSRPVILSPYPKTTWTRHSDGAEEKSLHKDTSRIEISSRPA
jgi:hypothetical protein